MIVVDFNPTVVCKMATRCPQLLAALFKAPSQRKVLCLYKYYITAHSNHFTASVSSSIHRRSAPARETRTRVQRSVGTNKMTLISTSPVGLSVTVTSEIRSCHSWSHTPEAGTNFQNKSMAYVFKPEGNLKYIWSMGFRKLEYV